MKTYGDLLTALIAHYEKCIEELPNYSTFIYLEKNKLQHGLCFAAWYIHGISIINTEFIRDYTYNRILLCDVPKDDLFNSKTLLKTRVDRMKELFPKWENVEL